MPSLANNENNGLESNIIAQDIIFVNVHKKRRYNVLQAKGNFILAFTRGQKPKLLYHSLTHISSSMQGRGSIAVLSMNISAMAQQLP